jgi:hypothetical protein
MDQPTPEVADALSQEPDMPHNMMFMGFLTHTQNFSVQDLGGAGLSGTFASPADL